MSRIDSSEMFDFLVEDHHLMNGSVEDELQIAAKLGKALLIQNNELRDRTQVLWHSNEETKREMQLLKHQNELLRADADTKSIEQVALDSKVVELTGQCKALERNVSELTVLLHNMNLTVAESERLAEEEAARGDQLARQLTELELECEQNKIPSCLSPRSPRRGPSPSPIRRISSPECESHLLSLYKKSEETRAALEKEISLLLDENCDLFKKVASFESLEKAPLSAPTTPLRKVSFSPNLSQCAFSPPSKSDLQSLSALDITADSGYSSESWLTEKLSTLEDRYNQACDNCICGACGPINKGNVPETVTYNELFEQLFDALHCGKEILKSSPLKNDKK